PAKTPVYHQFSRRLGVLAGLLGNCALAFSHSGLIPHLPIRGQNCDFSVLMDTRNCYTVLCTLRIIRLDKECRSCLSQAALSKKLSRSTQGRRTPSLRTSPFHC